MSEQEVFRVVTLNCWGVFFPLACVRKDDRIAAIGKRLSEGEFDIVLLEEIWTDDDYKKMHNVLHDVYPYSNHFKRHLIGTGMCIFSKWPIESILLHSYEANGYAHRVHQGDWYCGKGVGVARIVSKNGFRLNFYVTHLIARYELDRSKDIYNSHRVSQLIELMEFVRFTSAGADAVFVGGDFNWESDYFAMDLLKTSLGLSDAWLEHDEVPKDKSLAELEYIGCTCDRGDNPYGNREWTKAYGNGERLDYLLYRAGPSAIDSPLIPTTTKVNCLNCWLDFRTVPDDSDGLHYSDHEGLAALFRIQRLPKAELNTNQITDPSTLSKLEILLSQADSDLNDGLIQCDKDHTLNLMSLCLCAFGLFVLTLSNLEHYWIVSVAKHIIVAFLGFLLFAFFWASLVGGRSERKALQNARQTVAILSSRLNVTSSDPASGDDTSKSIDQDFERL